MIVWLYHETGRLPIVSQIVRKHSFFCFCGIFEKGFLFLRRFWKSAFCLRSPFAPNPGLLSPPISPAPVTHLRRSDQAEKAQKNRAAIHRPNTLYHNTAVNPIRTPYTAFYIGGNISIPPNNKSPQNAIKTPLRVKHKNNRPGAIPGRRLLI